MVGLYPGSWSSKDVNAFWMVFGVVKSVSRQVVPLSDPSAEENFSPRLTGAEKSSVYVVSAFFNASGRTDSSEGVGVPLKGSDEDDKQSLEARPLSVPFNVLKKLSPESKSFPVPDAKTNQRVGFSG